MAHAARATGGTIVSATPLPRVSALAKGVNLSGWYGGWGEYSPAHLDAWTTSGDIAYVKAMGLGYVRLPIQPSLLTTGGFDSAESVAMLARFDASVATILANGLSVLINVFPRSDYKQALTSAEGAASFVALWKFLAEHFAPLDSERVFYDLLNEPELKDAAQWDTLQANVAAAIRAVDKQHTLIATGCRYAGIDELLQLTPLNDTNVVYCFHFYEPFPFTHQGATWGSPEWPQLKNVPYPADPEVLGPMVAAMPDGAARGTLANYAREGWDASVLQRRLGMAKAWAAKNRVAVACTEFGAFRNTIAAPARARYMHDVRATLEALGIGWGAWDYRGNFGMVTHAEDGTIVPDGLILEALGLTVAAPLRWTPAAVRPMPALPPGPAAAPPSA